MTAPETAPRFCACGHPLWRHTPPAFLSQNAAEACRSRTCPCPAFTAPESTEPKITGHRLPDRLIDAAQADDDGPENADPDA